eukprot:8371257-Pyramimonas_sp.AAC.1
MGSSTEPDMRQRQISAFFIIPTITRHEHQRSAFITEHLFGFACTRVKDFGLRVSCPRCRCPQSRTLFTLQTLNSFHAKSNALVTRSRAIPPPFFITIST